MKNNLIPLWILEITIALANIIVVAIGGSNLTNNILAWACCIIFTINCISVQISKSNSEKMYREMLENERKKYDTQS